MICAYLDDTYAMDEPLEAYACMQTGAATAERLTKVKSNLGKQEIYSPEGDLSGLPSSLRGSPDAPPEPEKGYIHITRM